MKVKIESLDDYGYGVSHIDGKVVFVENALPNEEVEIIITEDNKKYSKAKVMNYITKSESRVDVKCPYYNECGGCNLLHLNYEDTLDYKKDKLKHILSKFAGIENIDINVIKSKKDFNYRNKISLKIVNKKMGFYKTDSHELIEIDNCLLASDIINEVIKLILKLNITNGEITIRSNYNDEILLVINTLDKIEFNKEDFSNIKIAGVVLNNKVIYNDDFFIEKINDMYFKVSYDSFFQINRDILTNVFEILNNNIKHSNNLLDLYCGVGVLGINVSNKCDNIIGIEIVENAVINALNNAKMNNLNNTNYLLGNTSNALNKIDIKFDTVILDPPRSGLDKETLNYLKNNKIDNIIYMSCDPVTLARDIKELNYEVKKIYLLDMFPYTKHVECICLMKFK